MRKIMAPLVILNFLLAAAFLGFGIMVSYSGNYQAKNRASALAKEVSELRAKKEKLEKADAKADPREQGVEYLEQELGKSSNLYKDIETKRYVPLREPLNQEIATARKALSDSAEENLKAAEQTLAEKMRAEKALRQKVEQGRKELAAARAKNDEQEGRKVELINRVTQQKHLLDVVKGRAEQIAAFLKQFEAASGQQP